MGVVKSFAKHPIATTATIAGGIALTAATGGAALPVMIGIGVVGGVATIGKGTYDLATAKTDGEVKRL